MNGFEKDRDMAQQIARRVRAEGGRVFYVGGYVRDLLLKKENKDIDIEVHGIAPRQLEAILDSLAPRVCIGESFGIYGLKGYSLDIAMPRKEKVRGRGHRDFDIFVDPFIGTEMASRRRDFTINALMQDVLSGEIVDHHGGVRDLSAGILRHVDDASFGEDPLRVLRGAQFAARLEFVLAPETALLCSKMDLSCLPRERIEGEVRKALLKAKRPSVFFESLRQMNQLDVWFSELKALIGIEQNPKYHAEGDVWIHTMRVLDEAACLRIRVENSFGFMLGALTHDLGKALCSERINGVVHAYEHEMKGLEPASALLGRMTGEAKLIEYALNLVELHMKPVLAASQGASVKKTNHLLDRAIDPEALICIGLADDRGRITEAPCAAYADFWRERLEAYRACMARPGVRGKDLIEAGLKPDADFKEILAYAHKLHLAGIEKESALKQTLAHALKLRRKNAAAKG